MVQKIEKINQGSKSKPNLDQKTRHVQFEKINERKANLFVN